MNKTDIAAWRQALESGDEWDGRGAAIPAVWIRQLLLGQTPPSFDKPRVDRPLAVKLTNCDIDGVLDLAHLRLPGGAALPELSLKNCNIPLKMRLNNCHLARLTLRESRITRLQAHDAAFESTIDLRGISAAGGVDAHDIVSIEGLDTRAAAHECSVDLSNSRIDGDVRLNDAVLCIGKKFGEEKRIGPKGYALVLRGADINGAVRLEPNFVALGGVTIADSHIHGDMRAHGARITARDGAALRGQNVRIDGTLFCCAIAATDDNGVRSEVFRAVMRNEGGLIFQNAHIGRVELDGAVIEQETSPPAPAEDEIAVDLSHARISGAVSASAGRVRKGSSPTRLHGRLVMVATDVGGDINLNGADIDGRPREKERLGGQPRYAVDLRASRVGGTLRLSGGLVVHGGVTLADAVIGGDVFAFNATLHAPGEDGDALRGRNASIAGVLRAGCGRNARDDFAPLVAVGGIAFPNASVDLVDLSGCQVGDPKKERRGRIDLEQAHIRGGLFICSAHHATDGSKHPTLKGYLNLTDARIEGDVDLHGLEISPESMIAVMAGGVRIAGSLNLDDQPATSDREPGQDQRPFRIVTTTQTDCHQIDLKGATVGQNLLLHAGGVRKLHAESLSAGGCICIEGDRPGSGTVAALSLRMAGASAAGGFELRDLTLLNTEAGGMRVTGDMTLERVKVDGRLEFDRLEVSGRLELLDVPFRRDDLQAANPSSPQTGARPELPSLYLDFARISGVLQIRSVGAGATREDRAHEPHQPTPHLSLIHARAAQIDDLAGTQWDKGMWLRLNGFSYDAIYHNNRPAMPDPPPAKEARNLATVAVPGLSLVLLAALLVFTAFWWRDIGAPLFWLAVSFWLAVFAWVVWLLIGLRPTPRPERVASRLDWLARQHPAQPSGPLRRTYHPHPYIQLARVYRQQGLFEFSDHVLEERVKLEVKVKRERLKHDGPTEKPLLREVQSAFLGQAWRASARLYQLMFGYGLKPQAAVFTFLLFIFSGAVAAGWGMEWGYIRKVDDEHRCHHQVSPALYAVDVFVPLLDLQTETRCYAPSGAGPLRAEAGTKFEQTKQYAFHLGVGVYAFIGWIVTSLTILTLTGVLRRFVEN